MKNFKIKKKIKNNQTIYYFNNSYYNILLKILNKQYRIVEEFKNDNRTYVAKILINNKYYILKKIYINKKIKKLLSILKKGEALSTLINVNNAIENGVNELAKPLGAIIQRKNGIIENEVLIMKCYEGKRVDFRGYIAIQDGEKIISILNKIYSLNRFHGDCSPANFYLVNKNIVILDTKLKKMIFGDYRKHYDTLTLIKNIEINYPYKKNIFYYFAYLIRKIRDKKRGKNV